MEIKLASTDDLAAINEIYNQSIVTGYSTCDTEPISMQERTDWYYDHDLNLHPIYVAITDKQIVGWISLSAYRKGRKALEKTLEVSYFIDVNFQAHGIGTKLMEHTIASAKAIGHRNVFAILLESNKASIALLKKFNFVKWAHLPGVAEIKGKLVGQLYYGKKLY